MAAISQSVMSVRLSTATANRRSSPSVQSLRSNSHVSALPRRAVLVRSNAAVTSAPGSGTGLAPAITLSDKALTHLKKMRAELNKDLLLRIGVRQGGCSGFSYVMDFEERSNIQEGDSIVEYEGFSMVCDPKSLLFLYGMNLDYSDALIGGGFSFSNPHASSTCGCGKSFAA